MAAPTVAQIDERIASAERDYRKLLAELRADRREAVARERQADRDCRRQVGEWIGELALSLCGGGWRAVDPYAFEAALARALAELEPISEMTVAEAQALWRAWRKRGSGKASQPPNGDAGPRPQSS